MAKPKLPKKSTNRLVFKGGAGASIGWIAAEDDEKFLTECFVDAGHLSRAIDMEDPGSIFVGRTGAGKSAALLEVFRKQENVILVEPAALSLRYISNSNLLKFFEAIPIDLDLFYQALWRHVFTIELLNYRYRVKKPSDFASLVDRLRESLLHGKKKTECISYLTDYQGDFFKSTQERVQFAVEKFETQLKGSIDLQGLGVPITAEGARTLGKETKTEIEELARRVVSSIQMDKLSAVNDFMAEYSFSDSENKHFIIVDRLDEDWANDEIRFKLIRALIETIKSFRKIRSVKVLISLRVDLLDRVYSSTRSRGFQREKYQQYEIDVKWTSDALYELADRRIRTLLRRQYTRDQVGFKELFPAKYRDNAPIFDHILSRTLYRPRDLIQFINETLLNSIGKTAISSNVLDAAESKYSKRRIAALTDEWSGEHPAIGRCFELFRGGFSQFRLSDLGGERLDDLCLASSAHSDSIGLAAQRVLTSNAEIEEFAKEMLVALYKVGFVFVRPAISTRVERAHLGGIALIAADIGESMRFEISPMVWRGLNVTKGSFKGEAI